MKPATPKARALLGKLEALAERGNEGEIANATRKIERLKKRYDFAAPIISKDDLFAGKFKPSTAALPVHCYDAADFDIANSVKWAIESATGITCLYQAGELRAQAATASADKLTTIATTITESFRELWTRFHAGTGANPGDRGTFMMGLYDGMMGEVRPAVLPPRAGPRGKVPGLSAKKRAVAAAPGVALHPYSVAVDLGKQIRFNVSLDKIAGDLEDAIHKQIAA